MSFSPTQNGNQTATGREAESAPGASLGTELGLEGGLAGIDPSGGVVWINPSLADWLHLGLEAAPGCLLADLLETRAPRCATLLREFIEGFRPWLQQRVPGEDQVWFAMDLARTPSGITFRLSASLPPIEELTESGWAEGYDTPSENRQMFVRLLRAESQLNNLMRRWPGVIFSQRADFSIHYASPRIAELTGVPEDDWRNAPQRFWQVVHEADAEDLRRQCRASTKALGGVSTTYRLRNAQTSQISYVLEHRHALISKSGLVLGYECFWLDITRQTIAEKRLSSAAWKNTLATLTMGLAHDFGNIMSGILSLSELFLSQTQPDHPFHEGLGLIKDQSLQASNLVHRIVNLHRCKTGERNYHDLNQLIHELTDLVQKVLPRRIRIKTEPSPLTLPVYLDGVEFRQVMLNLGLNAGDAMPQGGTLTLRIVRFNEAQVPPNMHGEFPRLPCVCIEVQDDGTGISPRHLPFLFDPFFTTKPVNKGSGLGLYNARLFVEKHSGAISVESGEGRGTTFRLWLPEADFTERERTMDVKESRHSILLAGGAGCLMDSTAEFLRIHDFYVIATTSQANAREMLADEASVDAIMVLADPAEPDWMRFMADLPNLKVSAKLVAQLVGAHSDHADDAVLGKMHLVFTSDIPEDEFLRRLKDLLSKTPNL